MDCSICLSTLKEPVSIPCGHIYCSGCIADHVNFAEDEDEPTSMSACPTCRQPFNIYTPDLSLLSKKYRPYILPSIRRVYLDHSPYQALQKKLKEAEKRVRILEVTKEDLLRECERHLAASKAHAAGEHQARMELAAARNSPLRARLEQEVAFLEAELGKTERERDTMRKKHDRSKALLREQAEQYEARETELKAQLTEALTRRAGPSTPTRKPQKKRKSAVHSTPQSSPERASNEPSPQPCEDADVPPSKRPKVSLPRRRVSVVIPSPSVPGPSNLAPGLNNASRLSNSIGGLRDDWLYGPPPRFNSRSRIISTPSPDIIHSSDEEC